MELSGIVVYLGRFYHVDVEKIIDIMFCYDFNRGSLSERFADRIKSIIHLLKEDECVSREVLRRQFDPIPTWVLDLPDLKPAITEYVPLSNKRKEPEPVTPPKFIGVVGRIEDGEIESSHRFRFEDYDEGLASLETVRKIYRSHRFDSFAVIVNPEEGEPMTIKSIDLIVDECKANK